MAVLRPLLLQPILFSPHHSISSSPLEHFRSGSLHPITLCRLQDPNQGSTFLVKAVETRSGGFELFKPLTVPTSSFILGKLLNVLECRICEMAKFVCYDGDPISYNCSVNKVVLLRDYGFVVVCDTGMLKFRRFDCDNWVDVGSENVEYVDVVFYKGFYFVVDCHWVLYHIDEESLNLVECSDKIDCEGRVRNVVESNGCLFAVCTEFPERRPPRRGRRPKRTAAADDENGKYMVVGMRVYKLDEQCRKWVEVYSLGDQVFVLGKEFCFAFSSLDFLGTPPNCVHFIDRVLLDRKPPVRRYYDVQMGGYYGAHVFSLDDRSFKDAASSPAYMLLFNLPKKWICSTLSFP